MTTDPHGADPHSTDPHDLLVRLRSLGRDEPPFATPVAAMIPTAVRRGRRRRVAGIASHTVAVAVPLVVGGVAFALLRPTVEPAVNPVGSAAQTTTHTTSARPTPPPPVATGTGSPSATSSPTSAVPPPVGSSGSASASSTQQEIALPCDAGYLTAKALWSGQGMNQPWTVVVVTNWTGKPCMLGGYPTLAVTTGPVGGRGGGGAGPGVGAPTLAVTHGSTFGVQDPGARSFRLESHATAWFAVGTGLAYDGVVQQIDVLGIGTPGGQATLEVRGFAQPIQGNTGQPLPITVTAFAPGPPPASTG
jgi:hypothetical protein